MAPVRPKIAPVAREKRKVVQSPTKKTKARTGQTVSDLLREWGLPPNHVKAGKKALRYSNPVEKGVAWYWFARFIRERDAKQYGTCIACGCAKTFDELQAGHFNPASRCGAALLMDERNVNGECNDCNAFDDMHLLGYAENLDIRYGAGTSLSLRNSPKERIRDFTRTQYLEKAAYYRQLLTAKAAHS